MKKEIEMRVDILSLTCALLLVLVVLNTTDIERMQERENALKSDAQIDCVYDQAITDVAEIAYVCGVSVDDVIEIDGAGIFDVIQGEE